MSSQNLNPLGNLSQINSQFESKDTSPESLQNISKTSDEISEPTPEKVKSIFQHFIELLKSIGSTIASPFENLFKKISGLFHPKSSEKMSPVVEKQLNPSGGNQMAERDTDLQNNTVHDVEHASIADNENRISEQIKHQGEQLFFFGQSESTGHQTVEDHSSQQIGGDQVFDNKEDEGQGDIQADTQSQQETSPTQNQSESTEGKSNECKSTKTVKEDVFEEDSPVESDDEQGSSEANKTEHTVVFSAQSKDLTKDQFELIQDVITFIRTKSGAMPKVNTGNKVTGYAIINLKVFPENIYELNKVTSQPCEYTVLSSKTKVESGKLIQTQVNWSQKKGGSNFVTAYVTEGLDYVFVDCSNEKTKRYYQIKIEKEAVN